MTHFPTCTGCAVERKTCPDLARLRAALAGFGATTVKHKCKNRAPRFMPGAAVMIHTVSGDGNVTEDGDAVMADYRGVFVRESGSKGIAYIAKGTIDDNHSGADGGYPFEPRGGGRGFVKIPMSRMKLIDGAPSADVTPCKKCGSLFVLTGICHAAFPNTAECPPRPGISFLGGAIKLVGSEWMDAT